VLNLSHVALSNQCQQRLISRAELLIAYCLEQSSAQGTPRGYSHPFGPAHGQDLTLEVSICHVPLAVVQNELPETVASCIFIRLRNNPSWSVLSLVSQPPFPDPSLSSYADSEVQHLSSLHSIIQVVHYFWYLDEG
jgi:hypothetical protein